MSACMGTDVPGLIGVQKFFEFKFESHESKSNVQFE